LIKNAINKAYKQTKTKPKIDVDNLVNDICKQIDNIETKMAKKDIISVENIQDIVEQNLMEA